MRISDWRSDVWSSDLIVVNARGDDLDQTAGGGEGNGVIHQIFYDTEQPLLIAHHDRDAASGAGKSYAYIIGNIARLPRHDQPFDGVAQIDRIELGAGKLGVDARSFGDIRHQPVQAADVVIGNLHELRAKISGFYGAQRSEEHTSELPSLM